MNKVILGWIHQDTEALNILSAARESSQKVKVTYYHLAPLWAVVLEVGESDFSFDTFQYCLNCYHSYYYLLYVYVTPINKIIHAEFRSRQGLLGQRCSLAFFCL